MKAHERSALSRKPSPLQRQENSLNSKLGNHPGESCLLPQLHPQPLLLPVLQAVQTATYTPCLLSASEPHSMEAIAEAAFFHKDFCGVPKPWTYNTQWLCLKVGIPSIGCLVSKGPPKIRDRTRNHSFSSSCPLGLRCRPEKVPTGS